MKKILLLILLFVSVDVNAASSSYQVEVIVFENLYHKSDEEVSKIGMDLPDLKNSIDFSNLEADVDNNGFKLLSPGMYKLGGVYNELKASQYYRPILHIAWVQPQLTESRSKYVHVRKTEGISSDSDNYDPLVKVDGVVRVRSAQFLHVDVDMFYFLNALSESFIQSSAETDDANMIRADFAELKETRRMKLNELHYFDHPVFGVLVRVSRYNEGND